MQLVDSLQQIHPDKLIGVVGSYIKEGRGDEIRQALPTLIDKHPQLKDDLGQIMLKLKQAKPEVEVICGDHATVFACANCGGALSRQAADTVYVICQYCGCDAENPPADGMSHWQQFLDTKADFTLGSFFNLGGVKWQAIGVQRFNGTIREWDSEDKTWENSRASYTLWWMINEKRELGWLTDYGSKRYWSQKFIPKQPQLPSSQDRSIEYGEWKLEFAAGEFSYQPVVGDVRHTAEHKRAPKGFGPAKNNNGKQLIYAVESAIGPNGKPTEYEFIRSVGLSHKNVMNAIGNAEGLLSVKRWLRTAILFAVTAACVAALFFLIPHLLQSQQMLSQQTPLAPAVQVMAGELRIEEENQLLRIESRLLKVLPANTYLELELEIVDQDNETVGFIDNEFWHETGSDSDGPWRESRYVYNNDIRFLEPGNYRFLASLGSSNTKPSVQKSVEILISANTHPVVSTPFFGSGIAAILAGILSFMRSRARAVAGASIGASMAPRKRNRKKKRGKNS